MENNTLPKLEKEFEKHLVVENFQKNIEELFRKEWRELQSRAEIKDFLKFLRLGNFIRQKMRKLFFTYTDKPELMGRSARRRIKRDGIHRAVADYIAGMTDRFALIEYDKKCNT